MNTKKFHPRDLGRYGNALPTDQAGYVMVHDSPRYAAADDAQLDEWSRSRHAAVRAAARSEMAMRSLAVWQTGHP